MPNMTVILTNRAEIEDVVEVSEGSNGIHIKQEIDDGSVRRTGYIPYDSLSYVKPAE